MKKRALSLSVYSLMLACLVPARLPAAAQQSVATFDGSGAVPTLSKARRIAPLPVMYVSDAHTNAVNVFRVDNGRQVGSIA